MAGRRRRPTTAPAIPPPEARVYPRERALAGLIATAISDQLAGTLTALAERPNYNEGLVPLKAGRVGYQALLDLAQPAAASSARYTVPGEQTIYPLSVMATLATSSAAGTRQLVIEYQDANAVRWCIAGGPVSLDPSQTQSFCWHPNAGTPSWPVADAAVAPFAPQMLYPPQSLVVKLTGGQAGDQVSSVRIAAWVYPTGQYVERPDWRAEAAMLEAPD